MKLFVRILLSPFILIYGYFIVFVLTFILAPFFITVHGLCSCLACPIIWIFRKVDVDIKYPEAFFCSFDNGFLAHLIDGTVYIWGPYYITYLFIMKAEIWTAN